MPGATPLKEVNSKSLNMKKNSEQINNTKSTMLPFKLSNLQNN